MNIESLNSFSKLNNWLELLKSEQSVLTGIWLGYTSKHHGSKSAAAVIGVNW